MQIKRVEIAGFKSFVDRVSLEFAAGIAAVVGPNGCGKSNIVDAIRWAMGEQSPKNLRGRAMEDVIFGGCETRRPVGMAEVSLVFDNEQGRGPVAVRDYAEFMVTRRLYRNGDSEYLFNKNPCRLLDITELFMDTGIGARAYSIIEQGKIGFILNARAEDRRFLIEEAAGVSKFKARKKTALRKIEATRQNLLRLRDVIGEVRRQLNGLKRQARKAEQYRAFRQEQKDIELRFARQRYAELCQAGAEHARQEQQHERQVVELEGQFQQHELKLAELRLLQTSAEKDVHQAQEGVFHLGGELQRVEGRIEADSRALEGLARQQEQLAGEEEELQRRLADAEADEQRLLAGQEALQAELAEQGRCLAAEERLLEEQTAQQQDVRTALEEARTRQLQMMAQLTEARNRSEETRRRLRGLDERQAQQRRETVQLQERREAAGRADDEYRQVLEALQAEKAELSEEAEQNREHLQVVRRQLEDNEQQLLQGQEQLSGCRSRLQALEQMERSLEGCGSGTRALLQDPQLRQRWRGMVADLLDVPACYEPAVEAVLGERLQALVTDEPQDAGDALAALRRLEARGSLVLPRSVVDSPGFSHGRPLVDLLSSATECASQVLSLLAGVFLVDSLDPYLADALPTGVTLVTPAGDCLSYRGVLSGGGRESLSSGLLSQKREIKELGSRRHALEEDLARLRQQRTGQKEELSLAEETRDAIGAELHALELKTTAAQKDLDGVRQEVRQVDERLELLAFEGDQLDEERTALQGGLDGSEASCAELDRARVEQETAIARLQEELQDRGRGQEALRARVTTLKVTLAGLREREEGSRQQLQHLTALRRDLHRQQDRGRQRGQEAEQEAGRLRAQQTRLRTELEVLGRRREEQRVRLNRLRDAFGEKQQDIERRDEQLRTVRGQLQQAREALAARQMRRRECELECDHLRESVLDRYRVDLGREDSAGEEPFDHAAAEARLAELGRLIESVGEVNLAAIDDYRELEQRWEFLCRQEEDLQNSLEGLQAAIARINRTTRKRFRATFDQVNDMFQRIFPRLFLGGRAELKLTDEEDLLETGIEIVVQPPGKRLQSVSLLSGGEKALTAIALIFAIFLIKPSPFCVLDEVDAPLDEANIQRFNEMVREMSAQSQFIVITHNKRTMEMADILYGVTMEEPGISKLVSVRIND
jgi:chromosome segregation protein